MSLYRLIRQFTLYVLCLGAILAQRASFAGPEYQVIDLGVLPGGAASTGLAVGYQMSAAGSSLNAAAKDEAFYWAYGVRIGLGALPGYDNSLAQGMTEFAPFRPIVVGYCYNTPGPDTGRAFVSIFGTMDDLGSLGGPYSRAHAITGQGFIVGESNVGQAPANIWHAFRTRPYSFIDPATDDLGTLAGAASSFAYAVNNDAQVTGQSGFHAFRTAPFSTIDPFSDDLGTLGGSDSVGYGINDYGVVAGYAETAAISPSTGLQIDHAFLYDIFGMIDLGTVPDFENSVAFAINNSGQAVGLISTDPAKPHAMIWDATHGMRDLNTLISPRVGWVLSVGHAINDRGEIVGWGFHSGLLRGFLLHPLTGPK